MVSIVCVLKHRKTHAAVILVPGRLLPLRRRKFHFMSQYASGSKNSDLLGLMRGMGEPLSYLAHVSAHVEYTLAHVCCIGIEHSIHILMLDQAVDHINQRYALIL